ncbi:MAG: SpoIIE family protein phosphatase [Parachlamydiaceae bacterium]|nr:SpoIIE family protein phosphatase [Parachlamydiaceae bacterium]
MNTSLTQIRNLKALLEISKALGLEFLLDNLLKLILDKTTEVMDAERSSLFLYDPKKNELWSKIAQGITWKEIRVPMGLGIIGNVAKTRTLTNIPDAYLDPRFNPEFDKKSNFCTKAILCHPLVGTDGQLVGVIEILNKKTGGSFNKDDEELLEALGGQATIALQRAQLVDSYIESQKMEETLKQARDIQMSFLPNTLSISQKTDKLGIYAIVEPAKVVGGDFYDFFFLDDDHLCFAIGDVSGKGIPAALFMAVTSTLFKALTLKEMSPAQILAKINNNLVYNNDKCMFVTFFCGILKLSTGEIEYSNGGHNHPYIVHNDQTFNAIKDSINIPLGILEEFTFSSSTTCLQKGDILLLYTDGINEAMDIEGNQYSYKLFETLLKSRPFASAHDLINTTIKEVKGFIKEATQSDDITLFAIHFKSNPL